MAHLAATTRICALFCGAFVAIAAMSASVNASIVVPNLPEFTLQDSGNVGIVSTDDVQSNGHREQTKNEQSSPAVPADVLYGGNQAAPATSPTSSSSGSGGGTTIVVYACLHAEITSDPELAGWVSSGGRLTLPVPVGNDLLRPPQSAFV